MNNIRFIFSTVVLLVMQLVIFNNIQLHSYIYINIYILSIFIIPYRYRPIPVMLYGFILGLFMDLADHTMGIHAFATTLIAYLRPRLLVLTSTREHIDDVHGKQSINNFGWFFKYILIMTLIFNVVLVMGETFSFSNILNTLMRILFSSVVSLLFMTCYYFIAIKQKQ
ncbi:MAG: rod shape-determining protein MreD [Marinifilaceae bacterium]